MARVGGWVAKKVVWVAKRPLVTAAFWLRIQTSLKNHKWATKAKESPTLSSPPKTYTINY